MKFKIVFLLIFASVVCFSQDGTQAKIDSLYGLLNKAGKMGEKSTIYSELSLHLSGTDSVKAMEFGKKAYELALVAKDSFYRSKANFALGGVYLDYDHPKKAQGYYLKAKEQLEQLIRKDSLDRYLKLWVRATFNVGVSLSAQGLHEEQMRFTKEIIPIAERLKLDRILARVNSNLGINFLNLGQYDKAYSYFLNNGERYLRIKDFKAYVYDRLVFAACLREMDSISKMNSVLNTTKMYLEKMQNALEWQMYYMLNGNYHTANQEYDEAIKNYDISYQLIKKNKLKSRLDQLYLSYFRAYKGLQNDPKAKEYLLLYLDRAKKNDHALRELDVLKELAFLSQENGDYKQANHYLMQFMELDDSLNTKEVLKKINQLEIQYKTEKKEREILVLKNKNNTAALTLAKNESQRYLLMFVVGSLSFLLIIGYFVFRNRQRNQQLKSNQQTQEIQELKHKQASEVYAAMLEGQEGERKRIAADLHDGLAGRLSATSIKLNQLVKSEASGVRVLKEIQTAASTIDESLSELRTIARNLMPETIFKYGLKAAIEDYCLSINSQQPQIKFILQLYDTETQLPQTTALTLYRIVQELINNALKHSRANEILIQYLMVDQKVSITVEDNGVGFDVAATNQIKGMGWSNIRTRVAYLGGTLELDSAKNEGTNVHIEVEI